MDPRLVGMSIIHRSRVTSSRTARKAEEGDKKYGKFCGVDKQGLGFTGARELKCLPSTEDGLKLRGSF